MKVDLKTCHWTELPNGWTPEGAEIVRKNVDIINQRIDDYLKSAPNGDPNLGKFMSKFYNPVGEPCPALISPLSNFFNLIKGPKLMK